MNSPDQPPNLPAGQPRPRLNELNRWKLGPAHAEGLAVASRGCRGHGPWRQRKLAEAHELFALAEVSRRYRVLALDLSEEFRALLDMRVPVPCRPGGGDVVVAHEARICLIYRAENVARPSNGMEFISLAAPRDVWLPQVKTVTPGFQPLCLGVQLSAATKIREILLRVYGALSMQSVQLDAASAHGVLNSEAASYWLEVQNRKRIPLTREPFAPMPAGEVAR